MAPASDILSPLASPFYPSSCSNDCSFSVLYCDGVPTGLVDEHEAIANISDEIIDELFPPTAGDAAEMDAVDDFLSVMAALSLIEEREEKCRFDLGLVTPKRWETKRKQGLRGRPNISRGHIERSDHTSKCNTNEKNIIHHTRYPDYSVSKSNVMDISSRQSRPSFNGKNRAFVHRYTKTIQQPRKHN